MVKYGRCWTRSLHRGRPTGTCCRWVFIHFVTLPYLRQAKTALDMEIAVYRKLVECEEDRLGITASQSQNYKNINIPQLKTNQIIPDTSYDPSDSDWEPSSPSYRVNTQVWFGLFVCQLIFSFTADRREKCSESSWTNGNLRS